MILISNSTRYIAKLDLKTYANKVIGQLIFILRVFIGFGDGLIGNPKILLLFN